MKSNDFLNEDFAMDAHSAQLDHEVQLARQELFHAAEDAIALHKLLKHVSEHQGLEGWVSSKITLAADYLSTVRDHLEYQLMSGGAGEEVAVAVDSLPVAEGIDASDFTSLGEQGVAEGNGYDDNRTGFTKPRPDVTGEEEPEGIFTVVINGRDWKTGTSNQAFRMAQNVATKYADKKVQVRWPTGHLNTVKGAVEEGFGGANAITIPLTAIPANYRSDADQINAYVQAKIKTAGGGQVSIDGDGVTVVPNSPQQKEFMSSLFAQEPALAESATGMGAGSVATAVNANGSKKPKSEIGSLFGGTYHAEEAEQVIKRKKA